MTITEANHTVRLLRFATGQHAGTPEQIRESVAYLTERAAKPLQLAVSIDAHDVDAAIARQDGSR
ncbi:hypothetical protein QWY28_13390 [Nocardioides sp. SOB77]|uniref:Uncharacterized protein n=1 Tax=Nocardioides oceani TaxID=3058369 RepID=A0ABT8FHD9_9ACTN|nr:hypothetical protein [Nocardioides oceani]MDN4173949.1 hypothetical protein [Nocardioides oceani]